MQFVHPALFIENVDLSTEEILNFSFMTEAEFTEQHHALHVSETDTSLVISVRSPSSLNPRFSLWYSRFLLNKGL